MGDAVLDVEGIQSIDKVGRKGGRDHDVCGAVNTTGLRPEVVVGAFQRHLHESLMASFIPGLDFIYLVAVYNFITD